MISETASNDDDAAMFCFGHVVAECSCNGVQRKRAAGKSKMNALGHCMRKALSLVWGVWRNGQDFDPNWDANS